MSAPHLVFWASGKPGQATARVAIAGDFLPSGSLALPGRGWTEAADGIEPLFEDIDFSFVNLECPLDAGGLALRPVSGIGQIVSAESASLDYLKAIRCAAVGLANNHAYDFGHAGVGRTRVALAARDFIPLGAGRTLRDSPEIFVWNGPALVRVGFWAAARASRDLATRRVAGVEPATVGRARRASAALKSSGATFSIALLHCGCLRTNRPDPSDAALMDSIARAGFDLVAASHSHRISGARMFASASGSPTFCFYGIGTIVSGYAVDPLEREGLAIIVALNADGSLASIEVRPVWLASSGFAENPLPETTGAILERFCDLTHEISDGSFARRFYADVSPGAIPLYTRDLRAAFRQSGLLGLARKAGRIRPRHLRRLLRGVIL